MNSALAQPSPPRRVRLRRLSALVLAAALCTALVGLRWDPTQLAAWLPAARAAALAHPIAAALSYAGAYLAFAALALPGAWTMSVAGGALFGLWLGVPLAVASSTLGATASMLAARYLLRRWVERRFPAPLAMVNRAMQRHGLHALFAARLTPFIPFSAVNLAAGLTQIKPWQFAAVSLAGALPLSALYVSSGDALTSLHSPADVLSPAIAALLAALALAPFAAAGISKRLGSDRWPGWLGASRERK